MNILSHIPILKEILNYFSFLFSAWRTVVNDRFQKKGTCKQSLLYSQSKPLVMPNIYTWKCGKKIVSPEY